MIKSLLLVALLSGCAVTHTSDPEWAYPKESLNE